MLSVTLSAATCSVVMTGCGTGESNPPVYPVTGTVTYKGNPVDGATIIFVPISADTEGATGKSGPDGQYTTTTYISGDGMRPGDYMLKVFKYDAPPLPPSESSPDFDPNAPLDDEGYDPSDSSSAPVKNNLPKKYESEVTSGLKLTVGEEPKTFDIDLK